MPEAMTDFMLQIAAALVVAALIGAAGWVTWVSRKIPSFTRDVREITILMRGIGEAVKVIPQVQAAMAEHEKDDAALFADLEARMRGVERETFRPTSHHRRQQATSQA